MSLRERGQLIACFGIDGLDVDRGATAVQRDDEQ